MSNAQDSRDAYALQQGEGPRASDRERFASASTVESKCNAWLGVVCHRIGMVKAAAILIEHLESRAFVPLAVWPEASPEMARLSGVVSDALHTRQGVAKSLEGDFKQVAYPLVRGQSVVAVAVFELTCEDSRVPDIHWEIHWGSAWLINLLVAHEFEEVAQGSARVNAVMETLVVALRHERLQQALFELAYALRQELKCSRVAIGLVNGLTVRLAALSDAATFEKNTPLSKAYVTAMEEVLDAAVPLQNKYRKETSLGELAPEKVAVTPAQQSLSEISGAGVVMSYPLQTGGRCSAVLTLEREQGGFDAKDLVWLDAFGALAAPLLAQRQEAERGLVSRLSKDLRGILHKIFGPRHLVWKFGTALVLALTLILILLPWPYRVSAKTVIEGEVQRVAAAPFEGFIAGSYVRAGDSVVEGQLLAQLDDRELLIEEARWASERDQYQNRVREAMANADLTGVQVLGAQLRQAEAQLALVTEKIDRARIKAPFAGLVVSGDLSQQVGAPVENGKTLFEIAPLNRYRVILQVDEREIRHVQLGQAGHLMVTGIASDPMPFEVSKVTPVASAQEGQNFFRVEAKLENASLRLRPGMEGVGKVQVGDRSLWWVLTHSFSEWLTLKLWTWLP